MLEKFAMTLEVNVLIAMTLSRRGMWRRGLYESSRAVTLVDGLPRAPSLLSKGESTIGVNGSQK